MENDWTTEASANGQRLNRPSTARESTDLSSTNGGTQPRCVGCFRPNSLCYCDAIPSIDNQTDMFIVQHIRERDHPFNTARMVHKALGKSNLVFGTKTTLASRRLQLAADAGILFPTSDAVDLEDLSPDQRPSQLVLIDGTWAQAKSIVKALPQLKSLPCYKLAPTTPGQYRIRLEPNDTSLSTVEATVAALKALEPNTMHLDELLVAFEVMVQKQLDHPAVGAEHYSGGPISGATFNVPKQLFGDPEKIVVAYGEANYRDSDQPRNLRRGPVYWCAENLGTGERFTTALQTENELAGTFLKHLGVTREAFDQAKTQAQFCDCWTEFCGDAEVLIVYNQGTIRLLENVLENELENANDSGMVPKDYLTLKAINYENVTRRSLPELIETFGIICDVSANSSRAARRLAGTIALIKYLREKGNACQANVVG